MRVHRVYIFLLLLVFCFCTVFAGAALADDNFISISNVQVAPQALSGDGQVQVTADVSVDPSRPSGINGAYIDGPNAVPGSAVLESIQPGETKTLTCALNVAAGQLGTPVQLFVRWEGESAGNPFSVTVASANRVVFTRTISPDKQSVSKGDTVTLTYTVRNEGAAGITGVAVADGGVPGMPQSRDTISAGETATFTCSFTMNADFTSAPELTYNLNGETHSSECPARAVSLKLVQMSAVLTALPAAVTSGNTVTLICDLANSGNVKLSNIDILDGGGNKYYSMASLDKGETHTYSRRVILTQTTKFQFTISARDDSGNTVTFKTNELEVKVSSAGGQYNVAIAASADALQLSGPGEVNFDIDISNNGPDAILDAYVTDQDGNTIRTFSSLPPGRTEFAYKAMVSATSQYKFSLIVPGAQGDYMAESGLMEIMLPTASADSTPSALPSATPDGSQAVSGQADSSGGLDWIIKIMLVIGALIVVTVIVMIALAVVDKRRKSRMR